MYVYIEPARRTHQAKEEERVLNFNRSVATILEEA